MRLFAQMPILSLSAIIGVLKQTKNNLESWLKSIWLFDERLTVRRKSGIAEMEKSAAPVESPADCLQTIINGLEDEVLVIGPDFSIKQVNNAVQRRLGIPAANIVGQPCFRINHGAEEPCQPPQRECSLKRVLESGQSIRTVHTHVGIQADDGVERWVEVIASPIWDSHGHITEVMELVRDVSENKRLQKEIIRANRELLALNSIARALSQSFDLKVTLQAVAETMLDALEAQMSWIKLSDNVSTIPIVQASHALSATVLDELVQAASNMGFGEQTAASASYSVMSASGQGDYGQLWQLAVTPLKSEGVILGTAGVAAAKRPVDQQRIQLLDAIGHQIAVAVERCNLYQEVQAARDLRGELLRKVITAQEEERRRIARELHDETGQALTALRLHLEKLAMVSPSGTTDDVKAQLSQSLDLCQQAEEEVDKLIFDLRPPLLDDLGLVEAIEFYAQTRLTAAGIGVTLKVTGKDRRLPGEREAAIFRVMQESITNIIKHAHAQNAVIHIRFKTNELMAQIKDDGCGFQVNQMVSPQNPRRGLGLLGMRERMSLVGGSFSITSKPGAGTHIKVVVPLAGDEVQG